MHKPDISLKRLVHNGALHARDQILQEGDGSGAPLRRVRRVVDVVRGDVGQVGVRGVFEDVEHVDEVEKDVMLLAGSGGFGRAEWCLGYGGVVVRWWEGEDGGEGGESEGEDGGEVHGWVVGLMEAGKQVLRCW